MGAPSMPSIRSVAFATASVGLVVTVWVSLTQVLDLIFHFHPVFLGVAAAWTLRKTDGQARGAVPIVVIALLAAIGAIVGTTIIEAGGGPVDPHGFTAAVTSLGIAAGIYILYRPSASAALTRDERR